MSDFDISDADCTDTTNNPFTLTNKGPQDLKPFDWTSDDSVVTYYDEGIVRVEIADDLFDHTQTLASQRNKSTGGTARRRDRESSDYDIHLRGLLAEAALAAAYDEAELDEEIYHGSGDGGVDSAMTLDGEYRTIDIKSAKRRPPWMKIEKGAIESKNEDERCGAYMAAYVDVDERLVDFYGWLPSEDVIAERNLRETLRRDSDHLNYTVEGGFRGMPGLGSGDSLLF